MLDFIFILKSFNLAKEGLYLCFPGIGYRSAEEKFRKYLIENKFIKEFGILNNCKFAHTSISIFFLHLTKEQNKKTNCFSLDLSNNELLEEEATFEDNQFKPPVKEVIKEVYDPVLLEMQARQQTINDVIQSIKTSSIMYDLDTELQGKLSSIKGYKQDIIDAINEHN